MLGISHTPQVGGSSAGLMCGIVLKRLGHNVHILEQYPSSKREGLAAGVGFFEHAQEFLKNHDLLFHQPISILAAKAQQLNPDLTVKRVLSLPMHMSSWDVMYYRLRANFDGMASNFCPGPPPSVVGDGQAVFDVGKRVTNIQYVEGRPLVEFVEVADGKKSKSMEADLVIAADGSSSRVREILQPDLQREYPGYVAWRGTVPMRDLPNELMDTIELKTTFYMMHRDYMIIYIYELRPPLYQSTANLCQLHNPWRKRLYRARRAPNEPGLVFPRDRLPPRRDHDRHLRPPPQLYAADRQDAP
jgi:2-polyprenyl-6-methoxyphenol hydroxylase-like FAD-dependent oxidoreductase